MAFLLLINWIQAWLILRLKRKGQDSLNWLTKLVIEKKPLFMFLSSQMVFWVLMITFESVAQRRRLKSEEELSGFLQFFYEVVPYMLAIFEFITAVGFVAVFYCLFRELKKVLAPNKYYQVKYRTATYLSLISILTTARFFYYGIISLTYKIVDDDS